MKKKIAILLVVLLSFVMVPLNTYGAKKDTNKITIYMFRGKGCGYCRAFLNFLNDINPEYGKYFELKSYEVWNDADNNELLKNISAFLENEAKGVPYIIIGKDVFPGYASSYDEDIKKAIKDLYETKKANRYDVLSEYAKAGKLTNNNYKTKNFEETLSDEGITLKAYKGNKNKTSNSVSSSSVIVWNLVFTTISTTIILIYVNNKFKKIK